MPVLVKNGKPVFRSLEDFTNDQVSRRDPRAGVGQLADGRIVLVAVDGDQPGYSVGLTAFELAQTMAQLGAVTASALASGAPVAAAFDGQLLSQPSKGEAPIKDAQYRGRTTVLVGDGASDRKAALLADVVLAKGPLASWCAAFDVVCTPFETLDDVHRMLLG